MGKSCLTQRALKTLATNRWAVDSEPAGMLAACDGRDLNLDPDDNHVITSGLVMDFLRAYTRKSKFRLPTCQRCAVLWDDALDNSSHLVP